MSTYAGSKWTAKHDIGYLPEVPIKPIVIQVFKDPLVWIWLGSAAVIISGLVSLVLLMGQNQQQIEVLQYEVHELRNVVASHK
jgi:hypothetical protein